MKKHWLMGIIILTYGMSVFASDTASLTIDGRVVEPTCSTDVVNNEIHQRCGETLHLSTINNVTSSPARGVVTDIVIVHGDGLRQIVLNSYD